MAQLRVGEDVGWDEGKLDGRYVGLSLILGAAVGSMDG